MDHGSGPVGFHSCVVLFCTFAGRSLYLFLVQLTLLSKKMKELAEVVKKEVSPVAHSLDRLIGDVRDISENAKFQLRRSDQTLEYVHKGLLQATDGVVKSVSVLSTRVLPPSTRHTLQRMASTKG